MVMCDQLQNVINVCRTNERRHGKPDETKRASIDVKLRDFIKFKNKYI